MPQTLLIHHIGRIVSPPPADGPLSGNRQGTLHTEDDAWLLVEDGRIVRSGSMAEPLPRADRRFDAEGGMVLPAFVDAHTHLVFAASREGEFVDRIRGLSYQEIARRGGGILNSALRLRQTPEDALFAQAMQRLEGLIRLGTG
ncbi:MAG: imidazolonepropionase, partial [Bacteroidetes bacterium]